MRRLRWPELSRLNGARMALYAAALFALYLAFAALWTALALSHRMMDPLGIPFGHVFIEFWTAARAALGPDPAAIYDAQRFFHMQQAVIAAARPLYPWHYPPLTLLFLLPFALLPYLWAVPAWYAANLAGYLTLAPPLARGRGLVWVGLAFPGTLLTLHVAQFGLLLAAAFGWALLLLDRRPRLAGALIATLAAKPHLFLLVPLALLVSRRWRVFAWAAAGVLLLAGASALAFGFAPWRAMLRDLSGFGAGRAGGDGFLLWSWQPSVFVMARRLGLGAIPADMLQAAATLGAAAGVVWAWRQPVSPALQRAALVTAGLLATPYLYNYDLVLLILPLAWLGWHGAEHGWLPGEKLMLLLAWLAPGVIVPLADLLGEQAGALVPAALLAVILRRIAHERRPPAGTAHA